MGKINVSQKRIDANRRNALRSTGPKTVEGKEKSRRNSLVHGLAGEGVVLPKDETAAACARAEQWMSSLRPTNAFELGLVETIAVESVRIERCRIEERVARDLRARRAVHCWGSERTAAIEKVARGLPKRPAEIRATLEMSAPGCDWLIARWRMLGAALDKGSEWTDEQEGLALDLLGIAAELRDLDSPIEANDGGSTLEHRQDLVDDQLERLIRIKDECLDEVEDALQEATIQGLSTVDDPTLVLLRRYETASMRRLKWALDLMHKGNKTRPDDHGFGKRDFDPPAWKGPNPAAVPNFPTPRQMPPSSPAPGAERSHFGQPGTTAQAGPDPYFGLNARISPQIQAARPLDPEPRPRPEARPTSDRARRARAARRAAMAELVLS
ncbi:hypothetical protein EP7_000549 [Isosphaeraceae bacterium EP7]